jgi:hypothetical protein
VLFTPFGCFHRNFYSNADAKWCQSVSRGRNQGIPGAISERLQRSVNRKVQGSNPCPGAKFDLKSGV